MIEKIKAAQVQVGAGRVVFITEDALMSEARGEHEIGYTYATSDIAEKEKRPNGCHYLKIGGKMMGVFDNYAEAKLAAAEAGTTPSRWSKDHPDNAKFQTA